MEGGGRGGWNGNERKMKMSVPQYAGGGNGKLSRQSNNQRKKEQIMDKFSAYTEETSCRMYAAQSGCVGKETDIAIQS